MPDWKIVVWVFLVFLFAACGGSQPEPEAEATAVSLASPSPVPPSKTPPPVSTIADTAVPPPPTDEATAIPPTEAPSPVVTAFPATVKDVTIPGAEGLAIQATLSLPAGTPPFPGVILLHMLGSNRQVWADNGFSQLLADNGYAVLAVDMRGHGETGGSRDWDLAEQDLRMVWQWFTGLDEVDETNTAVIGASIGSNMALITGANIPEIKTAILLSPGLDYRGVTTEDALQRYGQRPLLIAASQEDSYAASSSETLADKAAGDAKLIMFNGAGHGTNMFGPQPDLAPTLLDWLEERLGN